MIEPGQLPTSTRVIPVHGAARSGASRRGLQGSGRRRERQASGRCPAWLAFTALMLVAAIPAIPAIAAETVPGPSSASPASPAPGISGDYLEARTADVYTGPCFANSEMDLVGKQAVMAWRVRQGAWEGVPLGGLSVVAAVRSAATLGDPFGGPANASALIVVDQRATPVQRDALVAFAHAMAGDLLATVVAVESAPIELAVGAAGGPVAVGGPAVAVERPAGAEHSAGVEHSAGAEQPAGAERADHHHLPAGVAVAGISGEAHLAAGSWIELATRGIGPRDHLCGNEEVFYPPLTAGSSRVTAVPAVSVAYDFRGPGLGMVWSSPGKRNAFVGRFER